MGSALEMQGLFDMQPAADGGAREPSAGGLSCDQKPDITKTKVCGKEIPSKAHFEWTTCKGQEDRGSPGKGAPPPNWSPEASDSTGEGEEPSGPPQPSAGGGEQPSGPPQPNDSAGGGEQPSGPPQPSAGGGEQPSGPPQPSDSAGGGKEPSGSPRENGSDGGFADSSGTVDISVTATPPKSCDASTRLSFDVVTSFDVTHKGNDGAKASVKGTVTETAGRSQGGKNANSRSSQLDVTQALTDSSGAVVQRLHLSGTTSMSSDDTVKPPTRTSDGTLAYEELKDGVASSGNITMAGLVRVPPDVCFWPIAGSITNKAPDGSSQVLVFSSTCGSATLDGSPVDLSATPPADKEPAKN